MLTFLLAAAISYTLSNTSVLQPPKAPAMAVWTSEPATREAVEFTAKDGSHIRGWIYRAKQVDDGGTVATHPFVLFFYGSNEDLVHEEARLAWLRDKLHVNAVCFDFPGYGFSTGKVSVKSTREIALEEYDFVHDHLAGQGSRGDGSLPAIVTYGWSIGTGLAVHVASLRTVAGLILQAPPASADEMAAWSSKHDVPRLARGLVKVTVDAEVQPIYNNVQEIASISAPLLVVQGSEDDVVPITQGREVFVASPAKQKTFVEVPGAHHSDLRVGHPPAGDAVAAFLQQTATGQPLAIPAR
jgi:pimeloyl-ACP methyl ester carboxylesterase